MDARMKYISAGINQNSKSLDLNRSSNLIAYSTSNHIILYNSHEQRVIGVGNEGHGSHINCVQWVVNPSQDNSIENILLTTSSDGTAKLWVADTNLINNEKYITNCLKELTTLQGHTGSVNCGYGLMLLSNEEKKGNEIFVVTTAEDFLIKGWIVNTQTGIGEEIFCHQLPSRSLALELLVLHQNCIEGLHWPVIVYGGDDGKIHILTSNDGKMYIPSGILSGHQDWVTSLAYCVDGKEILLASGSKDGSIRIWRLGKDSKKIEDEWTVPLQAKTSVVQLRPLRSLEVQLSSDHTNDSEGKNDVMLSCSLESVLLGHDGFVSSLDWGGGGEQLLSCATTEDRSIIIWKLEGDIPSDDTPVDDGSTRGEIWVEKVRLGEVGGNREGFFNARFSSCRNTVVATSYQGGLHMWHSSGGESWTPQSVVSGHFGPVVDLDWQKNGLYLVSVSKDQTTRLHAPCKRSSPHDTKWQEIARPQVHGYDMACIASLPNFKFASGGEEKVVRGFNATRNFVRRLHKASGSSIETVCDASHFPEAASVPSLGLSNKGEEEEGKPHKTSSATGDDIPNEDELVMGTLWPEVAKLYGHGHELLAMASSHKSNILASSCRATAPDDAKIIIWDTEEWKELAALTFHRLSVTQMEFSSCNRFLLSVSRDRSWAVWRTSDDGRGFSLLCHSGEKEKKIQHSRIIWSCAWVPGTPTFITGSRDKSVAVWTPVRDPKGDIVSWERGRVFTEAEEVVAVAATKLDNRDGAIVMAVGFVSGRLLLRILEENKTEDMECLVQISHKKAIRRLKFRTGNTDEGYLTLASCGEDHSVHLYDIFV